MLSPLAVSLLNAYDVALLAGMVPHHRQAVTMARMVAGNTDRRQLNRLAEDIVASQTDEIDTMRRLLRRSPEGSSQDMGHEGHDDMAMHGMMSGADMRRLMRMDGRGFDLKFIEMMMTHGRGPEVARLAQRIIVTQQREFDEIRQWGEQWR